jgi:hypothetical protein
MIIQQYLQGEEARKKIDSMPFAEAMQHCLDYFGLSEKDRYIIQEAVGDFRLSGLTNSYLIRTVRRLIELNKIESRKKKGYVLMLVDKDNEKEIFVFKDERGYVIIFDYKENAEQVASYYPNHYSNIIEIQSNSNSPEK